MYDHDTALQNLLDAGIPEAVAISMLKNVEVTEAKEKKAKSKGKWSGVSNGSKVTVPIIHEDTCMTCGCIITTKVVQTVNVEEADRL